jgi:hypothetical protein
MRIFILILMTGPARTTLRWVNIIRHHPKLAALKGSRKRYSSLQF